MSGAERPPLAAAVLALPVIERMEPNRSSDPFCSSHAG